MSFHSDVSNTAPSAHSTAQEPADCRKRRRQDGDTVELDRRPFTIRVGRRHGPATRGISVVDMSNSPARTIPLPRCKHSPRSASLSAREFRWHIWTQPALAFSPHVTLRSALSTNKMERLRLYWWSRTPNGGNCAPSRKQESALTPSVGWQPG